MEAESGSHHDDNINHQELVGSISSNTCTTMTVVMKGKRSHKSSFSSDAADVSSSTSSSGDLTEEEEDMANCLILLAQGHHSSGPASYECKTCNRTFHSFQALGGHRASHKKPRTDHNKKSPHSEPSDHQRQQNNNMLMLISTNKNNSTAQKIHECSICGAEFTSGQALGGHMRRHRAPAPPPPIAKTNNILALDLNLPAPEEDGHRPSAFVFSASPALVDCHN